MCVIFGARWNEDALSKELSEITLRPLHLSERQMKLIFLHLGCVHLSCQLMPQMIIVLTKYFPQQPYSVLFQRRESSQDLEATLANISTDNLLHLSGA